MSNILSYDDFFKPLVRNYSQNFSKGAAEEIAAAHLHGTINKGLNTTGTIATDGTTGGDALKQQDVLKQIAVAELQASSHATLWNWIKKVPTYSDVVERTMLDSWGGRRRGGFINSQSASGQLEGSDPSLERSSLPVRWMGGRYQVFRSALAMQSLQFGADPIMGGAEDVASTAKAQQLILNANEMCWFGDPDKNALEPHGVLRQIRDVNSSRFITRYNMKGRPVTPETMPEIEEILRSQGGLWTDFFWSPSAFADMRKSMLSFIRTQSGSALTLGTYTDEALIMDMAGNRDVAKLRIDNFLDAPPADNEADGPNPPTAPTSATITVSSSDVINAWGDTLDAGTYNYKVRAVGVNGWSAMVTGDAAAAPSGSQKVVVTIKNAATNNKGDVAYFDVFRGEGANGDVKYLGRVKANDAAGGADVVFYDDGEFVPGCSTAAALTNRKFGMGGQEMMVRQLYPMTKVRLPNDVMAEQAAWIMGFTPQVVVPQFCLVLENVGRLT